MTDDVQLDADVQAFADDVGVYRRQLSPDVIQERVRDAVTTWAGAFRDRNGVNPSQEQTAEFERNQLQTIARDLQATDSDLQRRFGALRTGLAMVAGEAQLLPDLVGRLEADARVAKVPLLSRQEMLLAKVLDHLETRAAEDRLTGLSFVALDKLHESAVSRKDVVLQRVMEQREAEHWPGLDNPDGDLGATHQGQLTKRIAHERGARVPKLVQDSLEALNKVWANDVTLTHLRKAVRKELEQKLQAV